MKAFRFSQMVERSAMRRYTCARCGSGIKRGERYYYHKQKADGAWSSEYLHKACAPVAAEVSS